MEVSYFPGCTLKQTAKNFEISAISSSKLLGLDLKELYKWNCCGTVYSLATDDSMHHLAPIRNLIRVREDGFKELVTLCSMCYNTLKQANELVRKEPDRLQKLNDFMYLEEDYVPDVEIYHLVTYIKEHVGYDKLKELIKQPLTGLKVAVYYGCLLLRPDSVKLDDRENPRIMEDMLEALGAEVGLVRSINLRARDRAAVRENFVPENIRILNAVRIVRIKNRKALVAQLVHRQPHELAHLHFARHRIAEHIGRAFGEAGFL